MNNENLSRNERRKRVVQERRQREKSQRVQSILEAAKRAFFSKGYLKATMDEIALEAEVSKPTVYTYFKTKDDLFFSLILPVVEHIGIQLATIESRLAQNRYGSGRALIRDLFRRLLATYEREPVTFRIVQLFQQTGLVWELNAEIQSALNSKGRRNFETMRRIARAAMKKGLLQKANVYEFVDVIWGLFVGIVQLEDIKSQDKNENVFLERTLKLAQKIVMNAMSPPEGSRTSEPAGADPARS